MREPSTNPSAATVLPEPVACSNQKRRLAPGSSGASSTSLLRGLLPVLRLLVRRQGLVLLGDGLAARRSPRSAPLAPAWASARLGSAASATRRRAVRALRGDRVLELGGQRGERPGENVDLMLGQLGAVGQLDRVVGEQPLEAEQQRVAPPPLGRGGLATGVELGQGGIDGPVARASRGEVVGGLAVEQDRLARELAHAVELIRWDRPRARCGDFDWFGHERSC